MTKVAVLYKGMSAEAPVSEVSGAACAKALKDEGFDVVLVDAQPDLWERLQDIQPDVIFNALHGQWGEDGRVQGILDMFGKPYTHSGVLASALAMDKTRAKIVLGAADIAVPVGKLVDRRSAARAHCLTPPYVIKPNADGSSVGVYIVREGDAPPAAIEDHSDMGDLVLAEEFVPGRELTVTVMGDRALAVTEIVPRGAFYDYDSKYGDGGSVHELPAKIPDDVAEICKSWALKAHQALGCAGISRSDFIFNDVNDHLISTVNKIVMLEINTQPGMTPTSLAPEQAAFVGMTFGQLCRWIVEDATWPR